MANDAAGTSWDEATPALADPRYLGQQEIRALRVGTRIRMSKEHETLTTGPAPAGGGEHKAGSAKAYFQSGTGPGVPTLRPDGSTSLDVNDDGRLYVDEDDYKLYVHDISATPDWQAVTASVSASGNTDITASVNTAAGWENTTGSSVLVVGWISSQASSGSKALQIDYGAGFVEIASSFQHTVSGAYILHATVIVPNGGFIRINPLGGVNGQEWRYQQI